MTINNKIKDIAIVSMLAAILVALQLALSFLPNIQLTFLLLFVYSRCLGTFKTMIIILINVVIQNLVWGSLNLIYTPAMFVGYMFIPILLNHIFKNVNNIYALSFLAVLCSLLYCWSFVLPSILLTEVSFIAYMISDILFEVILAGSSFVSVLWLYERLCIVLKKLIENLEDNKKDI